MRQIPPIFRATIRAPSGIILLLAALMVISIGAATTTQRDELRGATAITTGVPSVADVTTAGYAPTTSIGNTATVTTHEYLGQAAAIATTSPNSVQSAVTITSQVLQSDATSTQFAVNDESTYAMESLPPDAAQVPRL